MFSRVTLHEYRAVLHVHSIYSDGTGTVAEIIQEAADAGLDVLWLTDHDTHGAAVDPGPGYYGPLLFLVGAEVTPARNHTLVFGPAELPSREEPLQTIIDQVLAQGALAFIAHPDDPGNPTARVPSYRWDDRHVTSMTGLEVWNHLSDWSRRITSIPRGLWALAHPLRRLSANPTTLAIWDALGQTGRVVGIAGVDAHQAKVGPLRIFPYRTSFRGIRTHIFTESPLSRDWQQDERTLVDALARGRAALVNAQLGTEVGFRWWAEKTGHPPVLMGDEVPYGSGWRLLGLAPVAASWEIWCNGQFLQESQGTLVEVPVTSAGVWRVLLRRGNPPEPWLYSNPIYFR